MFTIVVFCTLFGSSLRCNWLIFLSCCQSPRWLLVRERPEEALASLQLYRKGKFTDEQIMEEYREQVGMINAITHDKGTFKEMWRKNNLKRTLIVIAANISIQISGQGLFSKYGTVFLTDLHGPDAFQMFLINTGLQIVVILAALYLFDKIGRKSVSFTLS